MKAGDKSYSDETNLRELKPIFHQNAKLLALGTFTPNAKDRTFALPNARNTNMLVSLAFGHVHFIFLV